jgi:DNA mismatch repair protein MutL
MEPEAEAAAMSVPRRSNRRPIAVLAPEVAERIAAGEVIDRPAAVVRELVDNALDAGATTIIIELRGGGLELIRVSDDGEGIPPEEVELAFQHHATSKITTLDDLRALRTLGFRGEALPSIAAVADVELLTRTAGYEIGTLIILRSGRVAQRLAQARQRGTTVSVRHLFRPVPARLKLVTDRRRESLLVGQLVRRYALARPSVRFSLLLDGRLSFQSRGSGRIEGAVADVYGPAIAEGLLPIPAVTVGRAAIYGVMSGRAITRPTRDHLMLVVNGRPVAVRGLLAALEDAYRPRLPRGRHPIAVLVLDVPPAEVDPNVHPAKAEIRLAREAEIAAALAAAVRAVLDQAPLHPSADARLALEPTQYRLPLSFHRIAEGRETRYLGQGEAEKPGAFLQRLRILGQVHASLILAESDDGLLLIDQHRAHERVIAERLRRDRDRGEQQVQTLLEPVVLELKPHQGSLLDQRRSELEALGLDCQRLGGRYFLLRTVPAAPGPESLLPHLQALLEEALVAGEDWRDRLEAAIACRAAVRRGQRLEMSQLETLVRDLGETSAPAVCPHGSPLILRLSRGFLSRQFGW